MQRMWFAAVAMFAFGLGCVAASFVVPPVRAGTSPMRWEYMCFKPRDLEPLVSRSNAAGADGWEMSGSNDWSYLFKRPLPWWLGDRLDPPHLALTRHIEGPTMGVGGDHAEADRQPAGQRARTQCPLRVRQRELALVQSGPPD